MVQVAIVPKSYKLHDMETPKKLQLNSIRKIYFKQSTH